jgi:hypothetical protein
LTTATSLESDQDLLFDCYPHTNNKILPIIFVYM